MVQQESIKVEKKSVSTRIRNSTKPVFREKPPTFFRCSHCKNLVIQESKHTDDEIEIICCGQPVRALIENKQEDLEPEHRPILSITGGYDANVATVSIGERAHLMDPSHYIEWVYLYTFEGGQLKFLKPKQEALVIFALAQEDSYVYCDRLNCMKCKFNCKRGFRVYAYCNLHGLWTFER